MNNMHHISIRNEISSFMSLVGSDSEVIDKTQ